MDGGFTHATLSMLAAFLASTVEFVEALTVVLAVGSVRNWRDSILGAVAALATLAALVLLFGAALTRIPIQAIQLVVGTLLLLFGLRWLRKAILRSAGIIPLHDESAIYTRETDSMRQKPLVRKWDRIAFASAFQITMLEGTEVVFIVIAIGAGNTALLLPASAGALAALVLVTLLGVVIHRPLSHVPENSLKFAVGVLLSAFGSFWFGESIGIAWPGADLSILALIVGFLTISTGATALCRSSIRRRNGATVQAGAE